MYEIGIGFPTMPHFLEIPPTLHLSEIPSGFPISSNATYHHPFSIAENPIHRMKLENALPPHIDPFGLKSFGMLRLL